jgi:GrpB-like predicted nucleotidyltransferase (UPF0157 family)
MTQEENSRCVHMRLVGGQISLPEEAPDAELWTFYKGVFDRLLKEGLPKAAGLARHVAFQCEAVEGQRLHFLGLEVPEMSPIPAEMLVWELTADTKRVWEAVEGRARLVSESPIRWRWLHLPQRDDGLPIGEFVEEPCGREFALCAHAYVVQRDEAVDDSIRLVEYDPSWPARAEAFAKWLREVLGPRIALRVEHYGSTAIPGMPAKPILDFLVEVPSFAEAREHALRHLNSPEWECWWCIDHIIFIRRDPATGERTHHVHLVPPCHREWQSLAFRDYLRRHPEDAQRYAALKRHLAGLFGSDRERYTEEKSEFVREILSRANASVSS